MRKQSAQSSELLPTGRLIDLVDEYLLDVRARSLSPRTVDAYSDRLQKILLPFCEREGIEFAGQFDQRAINKLAIELQSHGPGGRPLTKDSQASYLNAINVFLNWATKRGEAGTDRARLPRPGRHMLPVLSLEEVDQLEDAASSERDKLIVRLLADCGLRVGELLGLRAADLIEMDRRGFVRVHGKGDKERLVPVPPKLWPRVKRMARNRGRDEVLFMTLRRRPGGEFEALGVDAVESMLRILGRKVGRPGRLYPHLLRHSYATTQLARGMNPVVLARTLGHSSLRMIDQVYSHLSAGDTYEAMMRVLASDR